MTSQLAPMTEIMASSNLVQEGSNTNNKKEGEQKPHLTFVFHQNTQVADFNVVKEVDWSPLKLNVEVPPQ